MIFSSVFSPLPVNSFNATRIPPAQRLLEANLGGLDDLDRVDCAQRVLVPIFIFDLPVNRADLNNSSASDP